MDKSHSRIVGVDIMKGLGILLVVFGHLRGAYRGTPECVAFSQDLIYQFHIPLFFFLSGVFFRGEESWKVFIKKKIKRLYAPFVVWNLVFLVLDEILRAVSGVQLIPIDEVKHCIKVFLMMATSPMGGATWFLRSLFVCSILYKGIWALAKSKTEIVLVVCSLLSVCGLWAPSSYSISATLVAMIFYGMGHVISGYILKAFETPLWQRVVAFSVCMLALLVATPYNRFDAALGIYENKVLAIPMAFVGIISIFSLASFFMKGVVGSILCAIGKETMSILVGHFAAFKLVIAIQVILLSLPFKTMLYHPGYDVSGYW